MKRIGIYLESDSACGGSHQYNRTMVEALKRLPKNEFECCAIYSAPHWKTILDKADMPAVFCPIPRYSRWLIGGWRRLSLPLPLWRRIAKWLHPLARKMDQLKCDLWIFPSQDAFAYWMPFKSLTTIHDLMHRYERRFPEVGSPDEFQRREFHYSNSCRYAEGILVDSNLGKQHVVESYGIPEVKCHVLPYVAPIEFGQTSIEEVRFSRSLPEKYLFYPAQFWKHKNHATLLKALANVSLEYPDIQLVLVGSPKNGFDEVQSLIQSLNISDRVHMLGLVEDSVMPELYKRARALVMPTFFGPTNIPPLEAFLSDCPVAVSGIYAMKEQLGEAALYFDPNSVDSLSNALCLIWSNDALCEQLRQNARNKIGEHSFLIFQNKLNTILSLI